MGLVDLTHQNAARVDRGLYGCVQIGNVQPQAHRAAIGFRGHDADLGELLGEVQHPTVELEVGVADPTVRHDDRRVEEARTEHLDVPVDRPPAVAHGEIRNRGTERRFHVRDALPLKGEIGHGDSFG